MELLIMEQSLINISCGLMLASALTWAVIFLLGRTIVLRSEYSRSTGCELRWWTGAIALWIGLGVIVGVFVRHMYPVDNPIARFNFLYMDMMAVPMGALICVLLTHSKHISLQRILYNIIPFLVVWITSLFITELWYLYTVITLVIGYAIAMMIYIIHGAKKREHWLKDTYADIYGRSLNWTWIIPVLLVFLIVCWMLHIIKPNGISFTVYYMTSFVIWNFIFTCIFQMVVIQEGEESKEDKTDAEDEMSEEEKKDVQHIAEVADHIASEDSTIPLTEEEQALHNFRMRLLSIIEAKNLYASEDLTRDYLAKKMLMGHSTFTKVLKQATGQTFYDYINTIRVQKAARLLRDSDYSLQDIGEKVGYKYRSTFYRAFGNIYNCTPAEYRQKCLNGTIYTEKTNTKE